MNWVEIILQGIAAYIAAAAAAAATVCYFASPKVQTDQLFQVLEQK